MGDKGEEGVKNLKNGWSQLWMAPHQLIGMASQNRKFPQILKDSASISMHIAFSDSDTKEMQNDNLVKLS